MELSKTGDCRPALWVMGPELASWLMTSARRPPFSAHAHLPYGQAHLAQLDPSSHSCSAGFAPGVEDPALNCIFHQAGPAALLIRNMWLGSGAIDQPPFLHTMGAMGNLRDYHAYGLSLRPDSHAPPEPLGVTNIGAPPLLDPADHFGHPRPAH